MTAAVRQRRRHRRTRDIAPPAEVAQVPPSRDVQVMQPEGVPRPKAIATDPVADEAMAAGPSRRGRHRRIRDIAPPAEVAQVLPSRDVQVVQPEGVLRPEATATDLVADEAMAVGPSRRRRHRRIKDTAPPAQVAQVLAPIDVEVVQLEGVPRPTRATTSDPHGAGPSRRRTHRRTRDIVARVEGPQQPPARDVHVVQPEVVQRAGIAAGDHPWHVRLRRSMSRGVVYKRCL